MPTPEFTVEPARLRDAERQVNEWADRVAEHTSYGSGGVPRALDAATRALDGSALSDAVSAAGVATARAGDGLVAALRASANRLVRAAERYEEADREAARRTGGGDGR